MAYGTRCVKVLMNKEVVGLWSLFQHMVVEILQHDIGDSQDGQNKENYIGLQRYRSDYRGVGLKRFHCTFTKSGGPQKANSLLNIYTMLEKYMSVCACSPFHFILIYRKDKRYILT